MRWELDANGRKVWKQDDTFDAKQKIESPASPFKSQLDNQTQAVINQQNRTDEQKNADIINNAHGVQSQTIRDGFMNAPVQQAAAPVVSPEEQAKQAQHNERMKNPDYARLYEIDPVEADKAYDAIEAEGLGDIISANAPAQENAEQQEERLKRERRDRNLTAAFNMLGAVGNFVGAASQKDGRSVPVADMSAAVEKQQTASQAQREAAFKKLAEARRRKSDIIENGYKNAEARRKRDEDMAYKADQLKWQQEKFEKDLEVKAANLEIARLRAENQQHNAEAQQAYRDANLALRSAVAWNRINNGNSGNGSKKTREFLASDGNETITIPENRFKSAIYGAFSKLPQADQDKAVEIVCKNIKERTGQDMSGESRSFRRKSNTEKSAWVRLHVEEMHAVLEAMADEPSAAEAVQYLRNAASASKDGQDNRSDVPGFGDEGNDSRVTINGF